MSNISPSAGEIRDAAWPEAMIFGNAERIISSAASLNELQPRCMSFVSRPLTETELSACERFNDVTLFCDNDGAIALRKLQNVTLIIVANPRLAFMRAVARFFMPKSEYNGVHPTAVIDKSALIDAEATVGPFCVIGPRCVVGPDCVLGPHVSLLQDIHLGSRVSIAGGTVIGADGFGYERNEVGELEKFPHIGGVVIEDDVEIGSNTSIDRGTLNPTRIGARARIDNQVHIAHNAVIGNDAAIIAQAMIGGSVKIGDRAWIAPSATIMNQVAIGADATVGMGAVVVKNVSAGVTVMGSPAQPDAEFRRARAALKRWSDHGE